VTVHYYEPFPFTHQGAPWMKELAQLSGVNWGTEAERKRTRDDFDRVQKWSLDQGKITGILPVLRSRQIDLAFPGH